MLVRVMNWVSRHILLAPFMCLFLLFGSCGSSHKAIKSDVKVISKDSASESVNIVHGSSTSLSELITTNSNYVIDFCIYDTRKPPLKKGGPKFYLKSFYQMILGLCFSKLYLKNISLSNLKNS